MKNLKKALAALLACLFVFGCTSVSAFAEEPTATEFTLRGTDETHTLPEWAVIGINQARAKFSKAAFTSDSQADALATEIVKCDIARAQKAITDDEASAKITEAIAAYTKGDYDGKHVVAVNDISYQFDSGNGTLYPLDWTWLTDEDYPVASDAQVVGIYFEHYNGTWYNTIIFYTLG